MDSEEYHVDPRLPLALLEAIQEQDMPAELLPDENPISSFPHRFGLSRVVERQVADLRHLVRRRGAVKAAQVEALLRLVGRRPDAHAVFDATGRELARQRFRGLKGLARRVASRLPRTLRYRAAARALRQAHGTILIADALEVRHSPFELDVVDALTARAGAGDVACRLYGSLAEGMLELYGAGPVHASHTECQARGDDRCFWRVEEENDRR